MQPKSFLNQFFRGGDLVFCQKRFLGRPGVFDDLKLQNRFSLDDVYNPLAVRCRRARNLDYYSISASPLDRWLNQTKLGYSIFNNLANLINCPPL